MDHALRITGLKKRYGKTMALNGLTINVPKNTVYGFLGENGAGKTTTFSILGGFIKKTAGQFTWEGKLGMLPQDARFTGGRTIKSQLRLLAKLAGVPHSKLNGEIERVLTIVNMEQHLKLPVDKCSHGMYKRIGIAQALLGDPDLLLFDEPTAGLDPKNAHDIRKLIQTLNHKKTIVISSHNLSEIEQMCDHVGIIHQGKMVYEGAVDELVSQEGAVIFTLNQKPALKPIKAMTHVTEVIWSEDDKTLHVEFEGKKVSRQSMNRKILERLLENQIGILSIQPGKNLEQEYLKQLNLKPI